MLICAMLKLLSISRPLASFSPFFHSLLIFCIIYLRFFNHLICYIYLSIYIFNFLQCFSELDNVDVLFRLGVPPRIAPLTAGYPGLCITVCIK